MLLQHMTTVLQNTVKSLELIFGRLIVIMFVFVHLGFDYRLYTLNITHLLSQCLKWFIHRQ